MAARVLLGAAARPPPHALHGVGGKGGPGAILDSSSSVPLSPPAASVSVSRKAPSAYPQRPVACWGTAWPRTVPVGSQSPASRARKASLGACGSAAADEATSRARRSVPVRRSMTRLPKGVRGGFSSAGLGDLERALAQELTEHAPGV